MVLLRYGERIVSRLYFLERIGSVVAVDGGDRGKSSLREIQHRVLRIIKKALRGTREDNAGLRGGNGKLHLTDPAAQTGSLDTVDGKLCGLIKTVFVLRNIVDADGIGLACLERIVRRQYRIGTFVQIPAVKLGVTLFPYPDTGFISGCCPALGVTIEQ